MKHLFLTTFMTVVMLLVCNTQTRKIDSNKIVDLNDFQSLPTEDEWKAAVLPTEDEWKKAVESEKKSNGKE